MQELGSTRASCVLTDDCDTKQRDEANILSGVPPCPRTRWHSKTLQTGLRSLGGEKPMTVFTFHIAKTTIGTTVRALCRPPTRQQVPGLNHAECMTRMTLGAPILSPARMQFRHLTMFAAWESDVAIDEFLAG